MKQPVTVETVKRWAMANYNNGASYVIECMEDSEIQSAIDRCSAQGLDPMKEFGEAAESSMEEQRAAEYFGRTPAND